jgi:GTP-binding protein
LNELKQYNPELVDKQRILAITKCDILDEELTVAIKNELPKGVETVFISSVTGFGLNELKDLIWTEINKESNKVVEISHRPMEIIPLEDVEDDWDDENQDDVEWTDDDDDDDNDISKYKGIGWDDL